MSNTTNTTNKSIKTRFIIGVFDICSIGIYL